ERLAGDEEFHGLAIRKAPEGDAVPFMNPASAARLEVDRVLVQGVPPDLPKGDAAPVRRKPQDAGMTPCPYVGQAEKAACQPCSTKGWSARIRSIARSTAAMSPALPAARTSQLQCGWVWTG